MYYRNDYSLRKKPILYDYKRHDTSLPVYKAKLLSSIDHQTYSTNSQQPKSNVFSSLGRSFVSPMTGKLHLNDSLSSSPSTKPLPLIQPLSRSFKQDRDLSYQKPSYPVILNGSPSKASQDRFYLDSLLSSKDYSLNNHLFPPLLSPTQKRQKESHASHELQKEDSKSSITLVSHTTLNTHIKFYINWLELDLVRLLYNRAQSRRTPSIISIGIYLRL